MLMASVGMFERDTSLNVVQDRLQTGVEFEIEGYHVDKLIK